MSYATQMNVSSTVLARPFFFFFSCVRGRLTRLPSDSAAVILEVLYSWGVPVIGLNWFQNVAIYIIISHYF